MGGEEQAQPHGPPSAGAAQLGGEHEGRDGVDCSALGSPRVDVHCRSNIGRTALFCAALYGNAEAVRFFLADQRSEVNIVDKDGLSLLHAASGEDSAKVARLLLAEGRIYDVNQLDKRGDSPREESEDCAGAGSSSKC